MRIILMILLFSSLLFSEENKGSMFSSMIEASVDLTKVDLLINKDNALDKKLAQTIKGQHAETQIIEKVNKNSIIDLLTQEDDLRMGIISEASLRYANNKDKSIESKIKRLLPLYEELIYVFVLVDSNISFLDDLKGKRVAMGKKDTNAWHVGKVLKEEHGISWSEDNASLSSKEDLIQASFRLLTNKLDAFIYVGNPQNNLIEKHFQSNTGKKLKLIEIKSENFYTKEIEKEKHQWLDAHSKKILYSKALLVVHNFFFIKGKTERINKRYEQVIKKIKRASAKQIKKKFNIDSRTQTKWEKWLDGSQISYKELIK